MERHKINAAAFVILNKGNQFFLLRRVNTGYMDGMYGLPSGHLEENESPIACAFRELMEETGVEPLNLRPSSVVYNQTGGKNYVNFFFETSEWMGDPVNREPDKCDDARWFSKDSLPERMTPEVKSALDNFKYKRIYSEV